MAMPFSNASIKRTLVSSLPYLLFLFLGVLLHIPFYTHYFVPGVIADSFAYADFAKNIFLHEMPPAFRAYTPGYPLFLYLTEALGSHTMRSFFMIQTIINFGLYFLVIRVLFGTKAIGNILKYSILFVLILFFNSSATLSIETTMSPVQLYSALSLVLVMLLASVTLDKNFSLAYIGGSTVVLCLLMLLRPQAIVFGPLFLLVLIYLLLDKKYKLIAVAVSLPVLVFMSTCSYNYYSLGSFTFSVQQYYQKIRSSAMFVEKKTGQPQLIQRMLDSTDIKIANDFNGQTKEAILLHAPGVTDTYGEYFEKLIADYYHDSVPKAMKDSITMVMNKDKNMGLYFKKILVCYKMQVYENSLKRDFYTSELRERVTFIEKPDYFTDKSNMTERVVTKDYYPYYYEGKKLKIGEDRPHNAISRVAFLLNNRLSMLLRKLPLGYVYVLVLLAFFVMIAVWFTKLFSVPGFLTGLLIALIPLSNYTLISLFVYPTFRYSYTSDFFTLLCPVILLAVIYDLRRRV